MIIYVIKFFIKSKNFSKIIYYTRTAIKSIILTTIKTFQYDTNVRDVNSYMQISWVVTALMSGYICLQLNQNMIIFSITIYKQMYCVMNTLFLSVSRK